MRDGTGFEVGRDGSSAPGAEETQPAPPTAIKIARPNGIIPGLWHHAPFRVLFSVFLVTGTTVAGLVACGDDDGALEASPDAAAPDASSGGRDVDGAVGSDAANDAAGPSVHAVVAPAAAYPGTVAKLDATASSASNGGALTFAWSVVSVPAGSAVTVSSLVDATTATPSFVPDKVGSYVFALSVTSGALTGSTQATVAAVDPAVFYFRSDDDGGPNGSASVSVVGALEGDGGTPVNCFARDAGSYRSVSPPSMMSLRADLERTNVRSDRRAARGDPIGFHLKSTLSVLTRRRRWAGSARASCVAARRYPLLEAVMANRRGAA